MVMKEDTLVSPTFAGLSFPLAEIFIAPPDPGDPPPMVAREPPGKYAAAK